MRELIISVVDNPKDIASDYINLTDGEFIDPVYNEINFIELSKKNKKKIQDAYIKLIEDIAKNYEPEYAIDSCLLEKNTNNRDFFRYLTVLLNLEHIITDNSKISILVKPHSLFFDLIKLNKKVLSKSDRSPIKFIVKTKNKLELTKFNLFLKRIFKLKLYLLRKIIYSLINNVVIKNTEVKYIEFYWVKSFRENDLKNVFFPEFSKLIEKSEYSKNSVRLLSCQNLLLIPKLVKRKNTFFAEQYIQISDIFWFLKRFYKLSKLRYASTIGKYNIKPIIQQEIYNDRINVNILLYKAIGNFLNSFKYSEKNKPIIFYPFENQAFENRICVEAKRNNICSVAVQHSLISEDHMKLIKLDNFNKKGIYPEIIACNSDLFSEMLISLNHTKSSIIPVKSQRYAHFHSNKTVPVQDNKNIPATTKILVLFPLLESTAINIANLLASLNVGQEYMVLRFHPYSSNALKKRIQNILRFHKLETSKDELLADALIHAAKVITSATSGYLDAIFYGKKVLYIRNKVGIDFLLKDEFLRSKMLFASNTNDINNFVTQLFKDYSYDELETTRAYMKKLFGGGLSSQWFFEELGSQSLNNDALEV